jgi:hypothetical protein
MRQLDTMRHEAPRVREIAQAERVEMFTYRRYHLVIRQPHDMRAALQRGTRRFEAQSRNAFDLGQRPRVIEQQVLACIAEIADRR